MDATIVLSNSHKLHIVTFWAITKHHDNVVISAYVKGYFI